MPIDTIEFNGKEYPKFQSEGNAARWVMEFAKQYCIGDGYDIGCNRREWSYPGSLAVDPNISNVFEAINLPDTYKFDGENRKQADYIFSSHMLEHFAGNWMTCLDYWITKIKVGGIIFLYLPHKSQEYWLPENNRKHIHSFDGSEISDYLRSLGHKVIRSGVDLNNSFVVVCEKVDSVSDDEKSELKKRVRKSWPTHPDIETLGEPFLMTDKSLMAEKTYSSFDKMQADLESKSKKTTDGGIVSGELLDELKRKPKQFNCLLPKGYLDIGIIDAKVSDFSARNDCYELTAIYDGKTFETGIKIYRKMWDDPQAIQAVYIPEITKNIRFYLLNKAI